jgi:hypothetical protein
LRFLNSDSTQKVRWSFGTFLISLSLVMPSFFNVSVGVANAVGVVHRRRLEPGEVVLLQILVPHRFVLLLLVRRSAWCGRGS